MKKLNLLAIALLFTMTAKADHTKSTMTASEKSILQEVCEERRGVSKCFEDSANFEELLSCESATGTEYQFPDEYSETDIEDLIGENSDQVFSYRIVLDDQHDHIWSAPFKADFESCVENEMGKISKDDLLSNLMNAIYPATKACMLLIHNEIDRIQDCE